MRFMLERWSLGGVGGGNHPDKNCHIMCNTPSRVFWVPSRGHWALKKNCTSKRVVAQKLWGLLLSRGFTVIPYYMDKFNTIHSHYQEANLWSWKGWGYFFPSWFRSNTQHTHTHTHTCTCAHTHARTKSTEIQQLQSRRISANTAALSPSKYHLVLLTLKQP